MATSINTLVNPDMTLTTEGWERAQAVAERLPEGLSDNQLWWTLINKVGPRIETDETLSEEEAEDHIFFFLSIIRKIYLGEITPQNIDIDLDDIL